MCSHIDKYVYELVHWHTHVVLDPLDDGIAERFAEVVSDYLGREPFFREELFYALTVEA